MTYHIFVPSSHIKLFTAQPPPFTLILANEGFKPADILQVIEISSLEGQRTGFWVEFTILKVDIILERVSVASDVCLTLSPLACHSSQKSNF